MIGIISRSLGLGSLGPQRDNNGTRIFWRVLISWRRWLERGRGDVGMHNLHCASFEMQRAGLRIILVFRGWRKRVLTAASVVLIPLEVVREREGRSAHFQLDR